MSLYIALALGTCIFALGFFGAMRYRPSDWRRTTGLVLLSKPIKKPARFGKLFGPYIRYRYEVGGESYEGDLYAFSASEATGSIEEVNQLLSSFPEGAQIQVWHRNNRPAESCLHPLSPYSRNQAWALMTGGALVNLVAILLFLAGRH